MPETAEAPTSSEAPPQANAFSISEKQKHLLELCRQFKFILASGPRYSTKTVGCLHCIADHAWRTDRGNVALVSVSQSAGLDSGVWEDLVNVVIPQWIGTGMGMQWVRKPFIANVTKKPTCEVSNRHGNRTRIQLDSLKYEHEVEARFKNKRYSMMFVTELSNFRNRKTFSIWGECLRMLHLKENQHLFLADTNPADEGEDSWIYKVFFLMPSLTYLEYVELCRKDGLPILQERAFEVMKATTKLLEFQIEDNVFATQDRIDELVARYSDDQDLYDRYILGMWRRATTDAIFSGVFRPAIHVIGEAPSPSNTDPVIMVPQDSTYQLITGMDPGEAVNSAWALIEKVIRTLPNGKQISLFKILDELALIGEPHSLDDFSESVVARLHWWQEQCGRNFEYTHWSDRSVFDMKEPRELKYYHQIIYEASGGEILLRAADRGAGTIRKRVALFRKLLFENRVFFNNARCPMGIEMCRAMRRGPTETQVIAKGSKFKHIFDAITYAIASESYEEMEDMVWNSLKVKTNRDEPTLVSIPT